MVTAGQGTTAKDPAEVGTAPFGGVQVAHMAPLSLVCTMDAATAVSLDTVGSRHGTRMGHTLGGAKMFYVLNSKALVWGQHSGVWQWYSW